MCDNCDHNQSDSSFIFGIVIGAIIGAFVAIYIYKNNQSEVFVNLKKKLSQYFGNFTQPSPAPTTKTKKPKKIIAEKISVTIPQNVETLNLEPARKSKPAKMFKK